VCVDAQLQRDESYGVPCQLGGEFSDLGENLSCTVYRTRDMPYDCLVFPMLAVLPDDK
jgi:hypothetical protein